MSINLLVIDNFDSFTYNFLHLIVARALKIDRFLKWQVFRNDQIDLKGVGRINPTHIVISPGPGDENAGGVSKSILVQKNKDWRIFGVCLGMQLMAVCLGAKIIKSPYPIHGHIDLILNNQSSIFKNTPSSFYCARYHSLVVDNSTLPNNEFDIIATNKQGIIMGIAHKTLPWVGVQFHPESFLSEHGDALVDNFLHYE